MSPCKEGFIVQEQKLSIEYSGFFLTQSLSHLITQLAHFMHRSLYSLRQAFPLQGNSFWCNMMLRYKKRFRIIKNTRSYGNASSSGNSSQGRWHRGPLLIMLNVVTNQMIPRTHAARLDSILRERKVRL